MRDIAPSKPRDEYEQLTGRMRKADEEETDTHMRRVAEALAGRQSGPYGVGRSRTTPMQGRRRKWESEDVGAHVRPHPRFPASEGIMGARDADPA